MQQDIILKRNLLDGVDKSVSDYSMLASVKVTWTIVTEKMFKKGKFAYIGLRDRVGENEIIQVGSSGIKYRVIKAVRFPGKKGNIVMLKRIDGFNVTSVDINATSVGKKARIVSRKNFVSPYSYPAGDPCSCQNQNTSCGCNQSGI